jgi:hypothetical protein
MFMLLEVELTTVFFLKKRKNLIEMLFDFEHSILTCPHCVGLLLRATFNMGLSCAPSTFAQKGKRNRGSFTLWVPLLQMPVGAWLWLQN